MEGGERISFRSSSNWKKSVATASILVVDDDTTCLSIVAAILKKFRYEVVTVKHPNDALCTLRIKEGAFDLVVSDVHMPDMNGFELQQVIAQEFNLPVVLMSADDKEGVALKGLERGAAFFILKPVSPDDLRDLWQFASMKKTSRHKVVIEETEIFPSYEKQNISDELIIAISTTSADTVNKRKSPRKDDKIGEKSQSAASTKKPKVIWTNSLHNRFLEAIRSIGLDRAVPKKILEVMNVPGLTRENVASHLQKYRIFLRRVSDASYKIQYCADKGISRNLRSSCESSSGSPASTLISLNNLSKFNHNPGDSLPLKTCSGLNIAQSGLSGFGQSRLLFNRSGGSWAKPNIRNPSNVTIPENEGVCGRVAQNDYYQSRIQGHLASISLEEDVSTSFDAFPATTSYNILSQNNLRHKTNYVGYSISNIKQLTCKSIHGVQKYEGFNSSGATINLSNNSTSMQTVLPNEMKNIYLDDHEFGQPLGDCFVGDMNIVTGGEQVCDAIEDYKMLLMSSNPSLVSDVENGGETHNHSSFAPFFDLSEFDIMSTAHQQPLEVEEDSGFGTTLAYDQVSIQNQPQKNGSETTTNSSFYGNLSHCRDNGVLFFDQPPNQHRSSQLGLMNSQGFDTSSQLNGTVVLPTNKQVYGDLINSPRFDTSSQLISRTLLPLTERDDDDFLESLLAPFGEDQTPEGI